MIPSQMLKGILEGCVLAVISREETYGYEISEQLMGYGFGKITEGTVYPLLLRLEKNGLICATYRASDMGPRRKYYTLTAEGRDALEEFYVSYRELTAAVNRLTGDVAGGEQNEQKDETFTEGK